MKMIGYKLRCTVETREVPPVIRSFLEKYCPQWILCFEIGKETEKPHYHLYIVSNEPEANLRQYLRRNGSGNGWYAMPKVREIPPELPMNYLSYVLKGDDIEHKGFNREELEAMVKQADETAARVKERKKVKRGLTTLEQVEEECIRLYAEGGERTHLIPDHTGDCVSLVVEAYQNLRMVHCPSRQRTYVRALLLKHHPNKFKLNYIKQVADGVWDFK